MNDDNAQQIACAAVESALARYGLSKTANYFLEALRARPELVVKPLIYGALPGAALGGLYDVAARRREGAPHDWRTSLRRIGTGAAIGAGLGAAYGGFRTHQFGSQQKSLDPLFHDAPTIVYSQALDNAGQDLASDYRGLRPAFSEEKFEAGIPQSADILNAASEHSSRVPKAVLFKSPEDVVGQTAPRTFFLKPDGAIRDIAGRRPGFAVAINAPRGADDAWVDAQIDLIKKHQDYLLTGLHPDTQIPDAWQQQLIYNPEKLEHARAYMKERLRKLR